MFYSYRLSLGAGAPMRELSVFCDESGDFGAYDHHCPYYIVSLVFHNQEAGIRAGISFLENALMNIGFSRNLTIHTAPLIRREAEFVNVDMPKRKKLFDTLFSFFRCSDVSFQTFVVEKRKFGSGEELAERLAKLMGEFLRDNLAYLQNFDRVVVYYDKGQKEVTRTLKIIFSAYLSNVEFKIVQPDRYRLFQVADLVCTLELLQTKLGDHLLSTSEKDFFVNTKRLKKTYLRTFETKRFA